MWLKFAQEQNTIAVQPLQETGSPARSKFIKRVEFKSKEPIIGDPVLEDYATQYPEDVEGDMSVVIFDKEGRERQYTYPNEDRRTANEVMWTGGHAFNQYNMQDKPYY